MASREAFRAGPAAGKAEKTVSENLNNDELIALAREVLEIEARAVGHAALGLCLEQQ